MAQKVSSNQVVKTNSVIVTGDLKASNFKRKKDILRPLAHRFPGSLILHPSRACQAVSWFFPNWPSGWAQEPERPWRYLAPSWVCRPARTMAIWSTLVTVVERNLVFPEATVLLLLHRSSHQEGKQDVPHGAGAPNAVC